MPDSFTAVHRNEIIVHGNDVRRVRKIGVQQLQGGEQIIPAPVSRWQRYGNQESGAEQQSRLLGWYIILSNTTSSAFT